MTAATHFSGQKPGNVGLSPIRWEYWAMVLVAGMVMWLGIAELLPIGALLR